MAAYLLEGGLRGRDIAELIAGGEASPRWLGDAVRALAGRIERTLFGGGDLALVAVLDLPTSEAAVALLVRLTAREQFGSGPRLARLFEIAASIGEGSPATPAASRLFLVRGLRTVPDTADDGGLAAAVAAASGRVWHCFSAGALAELLAIVSLPAANVLDVARALRSGGRFMPGLALGRVLQVDDLRGAARPARAEDLAQPGSRPSTEHRNP